MRTASLLTAFGNVTLPDFLRLTGLPQDQDDLPWWIEGILDWLLRVRAINEAWGQAGEAARYKLEIALGDTTLPGYAKGPEAVYEIYQTMIEGQEAEKNSR